MLGKISNDCTNLSSITFSFQKKDGTTALFTGTLEVILKGRNNYTQMPAFFSASEVEFQDTREENIPGQQTFGGRVGHSDIVILFKRVVAVGQLDYPLNQSLEVRWEGNWCNSE